MGTYGTGDDVAAIEQKLKNLQTHYEARLDGQYARTADVERDREKLRVGIGKLVARIKAADKILKDVANPLRVGDLSSTAEAHLAFYGPIENSWRTRASLIPPTRPSISAKANGKGYRGPHEPE
jgi:hypothetical protein